jgi:LPS-assembly protein
MGPTCQAAEWFSGLRACLEKLPAREKQAEGVQARQERLQVRSADDIVVRGDDIEAVGNVDILFGEYILKADKIAGNRKTRQFRLEGNATVDGPGENVTGDAIDVNLRERTFAFSNGAAKLEPERLRKPNPGALFVGAIEGGGESGVVTAIDAETTTCELEHPHFAIRSKSVKVIPGKRADLRNVAVSVLGKTIIRLPMVSIPLERGAQRWLPTVGQSPDEGYYVKARVTTPLPGENFVDTRLDLMSRLGTGLGWDYNYSNKTLSGLFSLYGLFGVRRSTLLTSRHEQNLFGGTLSSFSSYQRLNYLTAPESTVTNVSGQYIVPRTLGSTRLTYQRYGSSTAGFSATDQSFGLSDSRSIGPLKSNLDLNFQRNDSSGGAARSVLQRFDVRHSTATSFSSFDAELMYSRTVPVGRGERVFAGNDVTPMLTLRSDSERLINPTVGRTWPVRLSASIGELSNLAGQDRVTRLYFSSQIARSEKTSRSSTLNWSTEFQQGLYSDDTAQYVLNHQASLKQKIGTRGSLGVQYRQLRPFGFSPVSIDQTGQTDALALDLSVSPAQAVVFSAQSGYDFNYKRVFGSPWRSIWLRGLWDPGPRLRLDASANYDTIDQRWSNLRVDLLAGRSPWELGLGVRYDFANESLAGVSARLVGARYGRTRFRMLMDYNGYSKRLEAQHYQASYDLHCAEAVLEVIDNRIGFRSGRTIGLYLRIKAFPSESLFGQGTRGQAVGSGFGFGD